MKRTDTRFWMSCGVSLALVAGSLTEGRAAITVWDSLTGYTASYFDLVGPNGASIVSPPSPGYFGGANAVGYQFTPISSAGFTEYEIQAAIYDAAFDVHGTFTFSLYPDSSGLPGASPLAGGVSGTLSSTALYDVGNPTLNQVTASLTLSASLTAGTPYYFVITKVNDNLAEIESGTATAVNGIAYYWAEPPTTPNTWLIGSGTGGTPLGAFSITAVPEPQTYGLLAALGLLGFAGFRRVQLRKSS